MAHTVDAVATGSCKNLEKRCIRQMGGHYFTERNGIEWFHHIIPRNGTAVRSNQTIQTELKSMYISLPPVSKVYVTSTRMLRCLLVTFEYYLYTLFSPGKIQQESRSVCSQISFCTQFSTPYAMHVYSVHAFKM